MQKQRQIDSSQDSEHNQTPQCNLNFDELLEKNNERKNSLLSHHFQQYCAAITSSSLYQDSFKNLYRSQIMKWLTESKHFPFTSQFIIHGLIKTKHNEAVALDVWHGYANQKIYILFVEDNSKYHQMRKAWHGNYGSVYKIEALKQSLVVKCLEYKDETFTEILMSAIYEVFFIKIASKLEVGPYYPESCIGFDLIVYKECMQFMMESCELDGGLNLAKMETDLKQNLLRLHSYNIVHSDIKQSNIGYSPKYKKYVFIDYGISSVLKQSFGELTLANFKGSYNYCSQQMKQCFFLRNKSPVDLYYNDAVCLKVALDRMSILELYCQNKLESLYQFVNDCSSNQIMFLIKRQIMDKREVDGLLKLLNQKTYGVSYLQFHKEEIIDFIVQTNGKKYYKRLMKCFEESYYDDQHFVSKKLITKNNPRNYNQQTHQTKFSFFNKCFARLRQKLKQLNPLERKLQSYKKAAVLLDFKKLISHKDLDYNEPQYLIMLSEILDITSLMVTHSQKLKLSSKMIKDCHLNDMFQRNSLQICFLKLLDYCRLGMQTQRKIILKNILNSIVILELITQNQLIQLFQFVLHSKNLTKSQKAEMALYFLIAAQWIGFRTVTKYNYQQILSTLLSLIADLIKEHSQKKDENNLQFQFLSLITQLMPKRTQFFSSREENEVDFNLIQLAFNRTKAFLKISYRQQLFLFIMYIGKLGQIQQHYQLYQLENHNDHFKYYHFQIYRVFVEANQKENAEHLQKVFRKVFRPFNLKNSYFISYRLVLQEYIVFKKDFLVKKVKILCQKLENARFFKKVMLINLNSQLLIQFNKTASVYAQLENLKTQLIIEISEALNMAGAYLSSQNIIYLHYKPTFIFYLLGAINIKSVLMPERKQYSANIIAVQKAIDAFSCLNCKTQAVFYIYLQKIADLRKQGCYQYSFQCIVDGLAFFSRFESNWKGEKLALLIDEAQKLCVSQENQYTYQYLQIINYFVNIPRYMIMVFKNFSRDVFTLYLYLSCCDRSKEAFDTIIIICKYLSWQQSPKYTNLFIKQFNNTWDLNFAENGHPLYQKTKIANAYFTVVRTNKQINDIQMLYRHIKVCNHLVSLDYQYKALFYGLILNKIGNFYKIPPDYSKRYLLEIAKNIQKVDEKAYSFIICRYYFLSILIFEVKGRKFNYLMKKGICRQPQQSEFVWKLRKPFNDSLRSKFPNAFNIKIMQSLRKYESVIKSR